MASGSNRVDNAAEIDRLALALAKEPGSKAFIPLAEEYGKAGMWSEAAAVLEDGLKTYPSFITAMVALGRTYDQMNQPVKATAILEEAVKLSPENLRAHRTLAKIYIAQGAKDAALRSCNVILAVNPQDQEALSLRAVLGAPVSPATAEPSRPLRTKKPGKPVSEAAVPPIETAQSSTAKSEPVALNAEERPATVTTSPQEDLTQMATLVASMAHERRRATVTQLEQWLAAIQVHRRDRAHSGESSPPTS
ncbi:MAG: tetratricopeptide repeat protein [Nitrospirae bacterium]|nr:tetratricopeptide repeat protein [Nitrospirota bacterium]